MATLAGVFFSLISLFGLVRCQTKTAVKKVTLLAFSIFLILGQILFINSVVQVGGDDYLAFSALVSGIILILSFQKPQPQT